MNTGQKFLAGILLGVAAGVAIALFVNSDKGKEIMADVTDAADEATESLKSKFSDLEKQAKDLVKKGKSFLEDVQDKAKDFAG